MCKKLALITALLMSSATYAEGQTVVLAKKLNNPISTLISVPIEYNKDTDIGPNKTGELTQIKFSPVLPFSLSEDWNIISRTIFSQLDFDAPEYGIDENGFSDIAQSVFFSPKAPTDSGWIWGTGGIFLLDTASDDALGAGKWGMGPTGVALKQTGPWTIGLLGHYLTDVAGDDDRMDIEQIFIQPFLSYTISSTKTTFTLQSEITRDMEANDTGAIGIFQVGQMFKLGSQIMQARVGVRHWYERSGYGPDSTELTLRLTFLLPK